MLGPYRRTTISNGPATPRPAGSRSHLAPRLAHPGTPSGRVGGYVVFWLKLRAEPRASDRELAQSLQDFLNKVRSIVDEEARTWATETLANFSQLERVIGANAEEARRRYETLAESLRAGALQVGVKNPPSGAWRYTFSVNGSPRKVNWPSPSCGVVNVVPGFAEVEVQAKATDGKVAWQGSTAVHVPSGELATVEVELSPVDGDSARRGQ